MEKLRQRRILALEWSSFGALIAPMHERFPMDGAQWTHHAVLARQTNADLDTKTECSPVLESTRVRRTSLTRSTVKLQGRIRALSMPQGDSIDDTK